MADRAVSPVVGKALEATLVVLYLGLVTATLYGGAVPAYRTTAAGEVAERTASNAATDIQRAVPPASVIAESQVDVELPTTIAGEAYRVYVEDDQVILDHPNPDVAIAVPLVVPDHVVAVSGSWDSEGQTRVEITSMDGETVIELA